MGAEFENNAWGRGYLKIIIYGHQTYRDEKYFQNKTIDFFLLIISPQKEVFRYILLKTGKSLLT